MSTTYPRTNALRCTLLLDYTHGRALSISCFIQTDRMTCGLRLNYEKSCEKSISFVTYLDHVYGSGTWRVHMILTGRPGLLGCAFLDTTSRKGPGKVLLIVCMNLH